MKRLGYSLLYLMSIHIIALLVYLLFRLYLFCAIDYEFPLEIGFTTKAIAFVKGLWFDNVIACYIMILPLTIMCIANLFKRIPKFVPYSCMIIAGMLFSLSFIASSANIPYFIYFFNNINSSIFNWMGYGATTGGMIFGESSYYLPILCYFIATITFWWVLNELTKKFCRITENYPPRSQYPYNQAIVVLAGLACIGLCFFGIRGRTGYNPIKVSQAYYCQDPFLNQLGINPTFNLLTSTLDDMRKENRPIELLSDEVAVSNVQHYLNRQGIDGISPIARVVSGNDSTYRKNIVIILMESMSADLMKTFGQNKNLTPYLDSLYQVSRSYENFYSSGLHTNHGIYATLYSFPTIMKRNAMKGTTIPVYSGLPTILAENGYHNMFFMTHESQYDNMNAFFRTNGFHEIYAEEDYPTDKRVNSFGVQDDFLFSYALPVIDERAKTGQPFMSVLLTISNHPPYIVPENQKYNTIEPHDRIVEYADRSIKEFMTEASKTSWWDSTIFVLLGDHGKLVGTPESEMPQSYNHVPLIIHGEGIEAEIVSDFAGQIDVAPTLLDMLGIGYTQNNFGINLNAEKRPYIFYSTDKHIAVRDSSHLFIYEPSEKLEYFYMIKDGKLIGTVSDSVFVDLKKYGFSMLQSAQFLSKRKLTIDRPVNL